MRAFDARLLDGVTRTEIRFGDMGIIDGYYTTEFVVAGVSLMSRMKADVDLNVALERKTGLSLMERRMQVDFETLTAAGVDVGSIDWDSFRDVAL